MIAHFYALPLLDVLKKNNLQNTRGASWIILKSREQVFSEVLDVQAFRVLVGILVAICFTLTFISYLFHVLKKEKNISLLPFF